MLSLVHLSVLNFFKTKKKKKDALSENILKKTSEIKWFFSYHQFYQSTLTKTPNLLEWVDGYFHFIAETKNTNLFHKPLSLTSSSSPSKRERKGEVAYELPLNNDFNSAMPTQLLGILLVFVVNVLQVLLLASQNPPWGLSLYITLHSNISQRQHHKNICISILFQTQRNGHRANCWRY